MNPDKLFDYLDGKLSPADREQLEEKLMSDAQLRRHFEVARQIHRGGRDTREVVGSSEDAAAVERGGRMGRRIATAVIALVFVNVLVGLAIIGGRFKSKSNPNA
ncbi:MAG TPA: zf-HC2 domain-containing protein, partial [Chthoniobacterales bacterium]